MKDIKSIIVISIIPLIGLCIGVFHKKPDWYQNRSQARWQRKERASLKSGFVNTGKLFQPRMFH